MVVPARGRRCSAYRRRQNLYAKNREGLQRAVYDPDVLSFLANLSNDEVFNASLGWLTDKSCTPSPPTPRPGGEGLGVRSFVSQSGVRVKKRKAIPLHNQRRLLWLVTIGNKPTNDIDQSTDHPSGGVPQWEANE
ncbi:MAG: hypothetical protein LVT47_08565 [Cyanobacteria bacterium LVE1205-1]